MALEDFERETVIAYDDSDKTAHLATYNRALMNKLDKMVKDFPNEFKHIRDIVIDGKVEGKEYSFNKKFVNVRQPSKRKLTEEQKQAAAERMKKIASKKSKKNK